MTDLTNKVALITGSGKGIGKAIALRYAALGAAVVVNYAHDKPAADDTVAQLEKLGARALAVQADVAQAAELEHLFQTTLTTFGQLDIVVVNAGLELVGVPVTEFTEAQYDQLFATNTKGAFLTMQQAARHVADHGRIIYVSSSTAGYPRPGYALHGGSKVAPEYLVRVLAQEIGPRGVTVNAILPTVTQGAGIHATDAERTRLDQFVKDFIPMGRPGTVEDVANVAEFFASELSSFVSGQQLLLSGGGLT